MKRKFFLHYRIIFVLFICVCCTNYRQLYSPYISQKLETIIYKPYQNSYGYTLQVPKFYIPVMWQGTSVMYEFCYTPLSFYIIRDDFIRDTMTTTRNTTKIYIIEGHDLAISPTNKISQYRYSKTLEKYRELRKIPYNYLQEWDTVVCEGKYKGKYWKEIHIFNKDAFLVNNRDCLADYWLNPEHKGSVYNFHVHEIKIGYQNVPKQYKALFDHSLMSLQFLQDTSIKIDDFYKKMMYGK